MKPAPVKSARAVSAKSPGSIRQQVKAILAEMERRGTSANREGMARYGIVAEKVFGISVGEAKKIAKQYGKNHELALALWDSGWHDARMAAVFIAEPEQMKPAEMDKWCRSFQNWADCDAACFHVFDRTPYAFAKVKAWASRQKEFERRAAFALLASIALHDKEAEDKQFTPCLPLILRASTDERNFVKKGVLWALRGIGGRSPSLYKQALAIATELADSQNSSGRWIGKNTVRELRSSASKRRLERQSSKV